MAARSDALGIGGVWVVRSRLVDGSMANLTLTEKKRRSRRSRVRVVRLIDIDVDVEMSRCRDVDRSIDRTIAPNPRGRGWRTRVAAARDDGGGVDTNGDDTTTHTHECIDF